MLEKLLKILIGEFDCLFIMILFNVFNLKKFLLTISIYFSLCTHFINNALYND